MTNSFVKSFLAIYKHGLHNSWSQEKKNKLILLQVICFELTQNTDFDLMLPSICRGEELHVSNLSWGYVVSSYHVHKNWLFNKKRSFCSSVFRNKLSSIFFLFFLKPSVLLPQTKYRTLANSVRHWLSKRAFKSLGGNKLVDNKLFLTDIYSCP